MTMVDLDMLQLDDRLLAQLQFVAAMEGLTPNELLNNAVEMHLNARAELPEFRAHLDRYAAEHKKALDSLYDRAKIGARRRSHKLMEARRR